MKKVLPAPVKIKASGEIKILNRAESLNTAGAQGIGTLSRVSIVTTNAKD